MSDIQFIDGLIVKAPNDNAPEYVKAKLSIKRVELIAWLTGQDGEWINAEIKEAKSGKWYASVDSWKPEGRGDDKPQRQERPRGGGKPLGPVGDFENPDDIPF